MSWQHQAMTKQAKVATIIMSRHNQSLKKPCCGPSLSFNKIEPIVELWQYHKTISCCDNKINMNQELKVTTFWSHDNTKKPCKGLKVATIYMSQHFHKAFTALKSWNPTLNSSSPNDWAINRKWYKLSREYSHIRKNSSKRS